MRRITLITLGLIPALACSTEETPNNNASFGGSNAVAGAGAGGVAAGGMAGTAQGGGGVGGISPGGAGTGGIVGGGAAGMAGGGAGGIGGASGGGAGGVAGGGAGGGGNGGGGAGGAPAINPCTQQRVATANPEHPNTGDANADNAVAANAIDGNAASRWSSGVTQSGSDATDEWFQLRFASMVTLDGIVLNAAASAADYPRQYTVEYSTDGTAFDPIVTEDGGTLGGVGAATTTITFPQAMNVLAVRINQVGNAAPMTSWWSIHEITATNCVKYVEPTDGGAPDAGDGG